MSTVMDDAEQLHFESVDRWHDWLVAHHLQDKGVWLVSWRPRTGKPAISYEDAVEEALCFGWVDSTARGLDDERGMQWFAPRRKGSLWAASNKARVRRLEAAGRMTDAGRAVIEMAKADGSWALLEPVEALVVPHDLAAAIDARPGARDQWKAFPPTAQRAYLHWVYTAKRPETRARRVEKTATLVDAGTRFEQR